MEIGTEKSPVGREGGVTRSGGREGEVVRSKDEAGMIKIVAGGIWRDMKRREEVAKY